MQVCAYIHGAKRLLALALAGALLGAAPAGPADTVIDQIVARNAALHSFQTRMHVQIRMGTFPFLSPRLDGTAYYKRPDKYEIVFDSVPSYARGFNKLFGDIGDAVGWERDWNVVYAGVQNVGGRQLIALRMTKKIRSDQIKEAIAYIDPATYEVPRMEWHYFNGGSILMTQTYRNEGSFNLVSTQHADIHIPFAHAVADSWYDRYQTNVPVANSVFTK